MTLRAILVTATILVFATACSSTDATPTKAPTVATTPAATVSAQPSFQTCASDPADTKYVSPQAITPRVDGIFVGNEDSGYLVVLRYYPDHTAYLAVVLGNTPINTAETWVRPHLKSNTGPFPHDASGAFVKQVPAGDIDYTVWKYTGDTLVLHALSHHGCREHSMLMKFIAD